MPCLVVSHKKCCTILFTIHQPVSATTSLQDKCMSVLLFFTFFYHRPDAMGGWMDGWMQNEMINTSILPDVPVNKVAGRLTSRDNLFFHPENTFSNYDHMLLVGMWAVD